MYTHIMRVISVIPIYPPSISIDAWLLGRVDDVATDLFVALQL